MLNGTAIRGINQCAAAHYCSAADDYYAKKHAGPGAVRCARLLGLSGPVDQKQLSRLINIFRAYASTVFSSEGLTNDRVLIAIDTGSRTTLMNLYYVAISRGRQEARVYTDSVARLHSAIARSFDKTMALSIRRERHACAL